MHHMLVVWTKKRLLVMQQTWLDDHLYCLLKISCLVWLTKLWKLYISQQYLELTIIPDPRKLKIHNKRSRFRPKSRYWLWSRSWLLTRWSWLIAYWTCMRLYIIRYFREWVVPNLAHYNRKTTNTQINYNTL